MVEGGPGSPEDSTVSCYVTHNTQPVVVDRGIVVNRGVHPGSGIAVGGHSTPVLRTGPSSSNTGPLRLDGTVTYVCNRSEAGTSLAS